MTRLINEITGIIQVTYGDATQTPLDRECACRIIDHLRQSGWVSPDVVCAMVASAGGSIDIQEEHLADPPDLLIMSDPKWQDGSGIRRVSVKRSARALNHLAQGSAS